jgi:uncharacterized protein YbjT (DUF2867 family)
VAEHILQALTSDAPRNRTTTIGGPDKLSRVEVLAIIEEAVGRTARRRHVPVPALRTMKFLLGGFHPGMRYLLDLAIAESAVPDDPTWSPRTLDWTGPTTVRDVVRRWAQKA